MSGEISGPIPTRINLRQKTRVLELAFDDGAHFELPCEYLRVFSPAAEVKVAQAQGQLVTGKQDVAITDITPVGHYAIQLHFDDGHDTGVYSWKTLYELGQQKERNWAEYLRRVNASQGPENKPGIAADHEKITILYFATIVDRVGRASEDVMIPKHVRDVSDLLDWLRARNSTWARALPDGSVTVTVNKRFASLQSPISPGDEVAITP